MIIAHPFEPLFPENFLLSPPCWNNIQPSLSFGWGSCSSIRAALLWQHTLHPKAHFRQSLLSVLNEFILIHSEMCTFLSENLFSAV